LFQKIVPWQTILGDVPMPPRENWRELLGTHIDNQVNSGCFLYVAPIFGDSACQLSHVLGFRDQLLGHLGAKVCLRQSIFTSFALVFFTGFDESARSDQASAPKGSTMLP
jgi:hypothetical protein